MIELKAEKRIFEIAYHVCEILHNICRVFNIGRIIVITVAHLYDYHNIICTQNFIPFVSEMSPETERVCCQFCLTQIQLNGLKGLLDCCANCKFVVLACNHTPLLPYLTRFGVYNLKPT